MNTLGDYFKISSNISLIYPFSLICLTLIDVLGTGIYNKTMETSVVENHVMIEKAAPRRQFVRSDGALYVLMLALVVGVIVAGNVLSARWGLPRLYVQLSLYAVLIAAGYWVYRHCLVVFRYALTDRMLTIDRIVGKKVRNDENVHLCDIVALRPFDKTNRDTGKLRGLYVNRRRDALAVTVSAGGRRFTILMSPSEEFAGKLLTQWKTARKK